MVGRDIELGQLQSLWTATTEESQRQMITVVGEAGLGKSRLLYEYEQWLSQSTPPPVQQFKGYAQRRWQAIPYAVMRDLFCTHLHILDNDPPHIVTQKWGAGFTTVLGESGVAKAHFVGHLLGFDFTQSQYLREIEEDALQIRNRAFHYISQFFTAVSKANPTVIILEDIHWADKGSLDLYEYIAQQCHQTPLLLLALTRPILWEQRPLWGQHITPHTRLDLPTLTRLPVAISSNNSFATSLNYRPACSI